MTGPYKEGTYRLREDGKVTWFRVYDMGEQSGRKPHMGEGVGWLAVELEGVGEGPPRESVRMESLTDALWAELEEWL